MDGKTLEKILEIVDEYKKYACLEYGWNLNLWDRDDLVSGYPFINLKIFWRREENQEVIDVNLGTSTTYTLEELCDAINAESNNPDIMYDASGNLLAYSAAEIIETDGAKFKLMLTARDIEMDGMTITVDASGGENAGVSGIFGTDVADASSLLDDTLFEKQDTDGSWIDDTAGGAGAGLNILTVAGAEAALVAVTAAINTKDQTRAAFGYKMNRLESTVSIIDIQAENLMTAESRISDVDVSTEMAVLTRNQVLAQAGVSMLAQANSMPQMALTLLR